MKQARFQPHCYDRHTYFEGIDRSAQDDMIGGLQAAAENCVLISRLDQHLDLKEFQKFCSLIGKPKELYKVAHYSHLMKRQVIVVFENPQDKKHFSHVFRIIFPEYIIQETSKLVKVFLLTRDSKDLDIDYKALFCGSLQVHPTSVWVSTGAEIMQSDYKLAKHPFMQPFLPLKVVVLDNETAETGLMNFLSLNDTVIEIEQKQYIQVMVMFEQDDEQKAVVIEKKEQQKIEDDAEKCEKQIDTYMTKQMAMMLSGDTLKEMGFDKASTQSKANTYLALLAKKLVETQHHDMLATVQQSYIVQMVSEDKQKDLASQILYLFEANRNQEAFSRMNEPVVLTQIDEIQRYWNYEILKYSIKRDPTLEEIEQELAVFDWNQSAARGLRDRFKEILYDCTQNKDSFQKGVCCSTHASGLAFMRLNHNNCFREFNKLIVTQFCAVLGLNRDTVGHDGSIYESPANSRWLLRTLMPLLNSIQLYGRYKQQPLEGERMVLYHPTANLGQSYVNKATYRNANWLFCFTDIELAVQMGGQAIYLIVVPKAYYKSIILMKEEGKPDIVVLPPMQVIMYNGSDEKVYGEDAELWSRKLLVFEVCDDYKNRITWKRKELQKSSLHD